MFFVPVTMEGNDDSVRKEIQSLNFKIPELVRGEVLQEAQLKIYARIHNRRRSYYGINLF